MTYDVSTDIQAGKEYWDNGEPYWAILTWLFMFFPAVISWSMQITCEQASVSWKKVFGHLPLCQGIYHLIVLKKVNEVGKKIRDHESFYQTLDFDNLPENIKAELKGMKIS